MTKALTIAHFSDLHVLALDGVPWHRFANKRLSGLANLRFKRKHIHHVHNVRAVARAIAEANVGHVVVTGDVTNLALESEFSAVSALLRDELGLDPKNVTLVPGNHDVYTRGSQRTQRFARAFAPFLQSDLPELAVDVGVGAFPVVKLRGVVAVIGLSSAVPRLPLVAAGRLGRAQLEALDRVLAHPDVRARTPVFALHHPVHNPASRWKTLFEGLHDADALLERINACSRGLVLHGHLHRRTHQSHRTHSGTVHAVGATSASLHHDAAERMAGFNLYEVNAQGEITQIGAHILNAETGAFEPGTIPRVLRA